MKRGGTADLPLHYGKVPKWLYERMSKLGLSIIENILADYGQDEVLIRLADPFWFQSFGAVMGMDWHSSGVTTSVMGALKRSVNPNSMSLGIHICGGKGNQSRETPKEILKVSELTGIDGALMVRNSRMVAKVDSTALQDGYQLYLHNFILSDQGKWTVVQQGMHFRDGTARRYHWHSDNLGSFVNGPQRHIIGRPQGALLDLSSHEAAQNREGIISLCKEASESVVKEFRSLVMSAEHQVGTVDIDLKRLGAMLYVTREANVDDFEELLLLKGIGPRTMQALALVSEVIHGGPFRFQDPARFSFAHGGKDGYPFPVPLKVYDQTIEIFQTSIKSCDWSMSEKNVAIRNLHQLCVKAESAFRPDSDLSSAIQRERMESRAYGGRTVVDSGPVPKLSQIGAQLSLF